MNDKDVSKITLTYEDGTTKELNKAFCCQINDNESEVHVAFDFLNCKGQDLFTVVSACIELGDKLGMFDDMKEDDGISPNRMAELLEKDD